MTDIDYPAFRGARCYSYINLRKSRETGTIVYLFLTVHTFPLNLDKLSSDNYYKLAIDYSETLNSNLDFIFKQKGNAFANERVKLFQL